MLQGKKVIVVLPAYKAGARLGRTYADLPHASVAQVRLVDDASNAGTVHLARRLGIDTFLHAQNLGYGANQKTCYSEAVRAGGDVIVMVHPDYQYDPRLVTAMAAMVASGTYDVVLGSRILGDTARRGGMPRDKYVSNRLFTAFQNLVMGAKISGVPTGDPAFSRKVLEERSEEHTSELQSRLHLVCRLLLEKKKKKIKVMQTQC